MQTRLVCDSTATAAPDTLLFNHGGRTLGYDNTKGSGPLVVIVRGIGDLRQEYRYLRSLLTAAGYRFIQNAEPIALVPFLVRHWLKVSVRTHFERKTEL